MRFGLMVLTENIIFIFVVIVVILKKQNLNGSCNMDTNIINQIKGLHKILVALNAYGSLDLDDFNILENYLKGSFPNVDFSDT